MNVDLGDQIEDRLDRVIKRMEAVQRELKEAIKELGGPVKSEMNEKPKSMRNGGSARSASSAKVRISPAVIGVLQLCTADGPVLKLPEGRLSSNEYRAVNEVIELLGGKWNRFKKGHVFAGESNPLDLISEAIAAGEVTDFKKLYQFFETPKGVAEMMADKAQLKRGDLFLEPSAGKGALLNMMLDKVLHPGVVNYCEANPAHKLHLKKEYEGRATFVGDDFLKYDTDPVYDAIVMNPPFTRGQDCDHVTHAFDLLAPGGRCVAITSPSWQFRTEKKYTDFRSLVEKHSDQVTELAEGTFQASGTNIRTLIVRLVKN